LDETPPRCFTIGHIYQVRFLEDGKFYNAKVMKYTPDGLIHVAYTDYEHDEPVAADRMRTLSTFPRPNPPRWVNGEIVVDFPCADCTQALVNIRTPTEDDWRFVDVHNKRLTTDRGRIGGVFSPDENRCNIPLDPGQYIMIVTVAKRFNQNTVWSNHSKEKTFDVQHEPSWKGSDGLGNVADLIDDPEYQYAIPAEIPERRDRKNRSSRTHSSESGRNRQSHSHSVPSASNSNRMQPNREASRRGHKFLDTISPEEQEEITSYMRKKVKKHDGELKSRTRRKMQNKFNLTPGELSDIYSYLFGEVDVNSSPPVSASPKRIAAPTAVEESIAYFKHTQPWYERLPKKLKEEISDILHQIPDRPRDCVTQIRELCDATAEEIVQLYKDYTNGSGAFVDPIEFEEGFIMFQESHPVPWEQLRSVPAERCEEIFVFLYNDPGQTLTYYIDLLTNEFGIGESDAHEIVECIYPQVIPDKVESTKPIDNAHEEEVVGVEIDEHLSDQPSAGDSGSDRPREYDLLSLNEIQQQAQDLWLERDLLMSQVDLYLEVIAEMKQQKGVDFELLRRRFDQCELIEKRFLEVLSLCIPGMETKSKSRIPKIRSWILPQANEHECDICMERYAEARFQCCKQFRYCKSCTIDCYFDPNVDKTCAFCKVPAQDLIYMTEFSEMMTEASTRTPDNYFVFDLNDTGLLRRRKALTENPVLQEQATSANREQVHNILLKNIGDQLLPLFPGGIRKKLIPSVYQHIWNLNIRQDQLLTPQMLMDITATREIPVTWQAKVVKVLDMKKKTPLVDFIGQFCPPVMELAKDTEYTNLTNFVEELLYKVGIVPQDSDRFYDLFIAYFGEQLYGVDEGGEFSPNEEQFDSLMCFIPNCMRIHYRKFNLQGKLKEDSTKIYYVLQSMCDKVMRKNLHEFYLECCLLTLFSQGSIKLSQAYQKIGLKFGRGVWCVSPTERIEDILRKQIFIKLEDPNESQMQFHHAKWMNTLPKRVQLIATGKIVEHFLNAEAQSGRMLSNFPSSFLEKTGLNIEDDWCACHDVTTFLSTCCRVRMKLTESKRDFKLYLVLLGRTFNEEMEEALQNMKKLGKKKAKEFQTLQQLPAKLYDVDKTEQGKLYFGNLPIGFDPKAMKQKIESRFNVKIADCDRLITREDGQVFFPMVELSDTSEAMRLLLIREPTLTNKSRNPHKINIRPFQKTNPQKTGKRISLTQVQQKAVEVMKNAGPGGVLTEAQLVQGMGQNWNEMRKQGDEVKDFLACIPHVVLKLPNGDWTLTPPQETSNLTNEMFLVMVRQVFLTFQTNQMDLFTFIRSWGFLHRTHFGPRLLRHFKATTITGLLKMFCSVSNGYVSPKMTP